MFDLEYKTRDYEENDYQFVYDVKKVVYQKYVEANWGEWNEEKQLEMFEDFISEHSKDIKIILVNNVRAGFFHGNVLDKNTYEQRNICLLPKFQGKGIGSKILKSIIDFYKDKDIIL